MTTVQTKNASDRKNNPYAETNDSGAKLVREEVVSGNSNWQKAQEDELKHENNQAPESPTQVTNVEELLADAGILAAKPRRERRSALASLEWARYRRTKAPEARQNLLNIYLPLVRSVAGRMAMGFPRSVDLHDLINTGVIGLIEAFANFDPDRGVKFETYAVPRIRGAILDELRALDWAPRSTRAKARNIDKAINALENDFGRPPTNDELAKRLEYSVEELLAAQDDVSSATILSLDEVIYGDDDNRQVPRIEAVEDPQGSSVLNSLMKDEVRAFLRMAIGQLTEQEKLVVALYYFEELTLKEIGEVMKISESRVSQIHTKSVSKLRALIKERFGPHPES
ncbi:MAG: FliA/WhiG family RNA polymerase sigma factor [candidate division Zixibacteria bacterium]|nr:FliA/WhiG family RNA polymerase sigma factor [candidate division Zixibacteria bacterium]